MLLGQGKVSFVVSNTKGQSRALARTLSSSQWSQSRPPLTLGLAFWRPTAKLLTPILTAPEGADKVEVEILTRTKDEAENKALFERIIDAIGDGVSLVIELFAELPI